MMLKRIFCFVICLVLFNSYSQEKQNKSVDSLKLILGKEKSIDSIISKTISLSRIFNKYDLDSSFFYAQKSYLLAKKNTNSSALAKASCYMGEVCWYNSKFKEGIVYCKEGLEKAKINNDTITTANCYMNMALCYNRMGDLDSAIKYAFKSIRITEKLKNKINYAIDCVNIAIFFRNDKKFEKNIYYNKIALGIFLQKKEYYRVAICYNNLSGGYNEMKQYALGIKYGKIAQKYFYDNGFYRQTAYPYTNIAIAYDSLKKYSEAKTNYIKSINLHTKNYDPYELSFLNNALANLYFKQKQYKSAIETAQISKQKADEIDALELKVTSRLLMAKSYSKTGNFKLSSHYYQEYVEFNTRWIEIAKTQDVEAFQQKYETEKKEKLLVKANSDLVLKEAKIKQRNSYLFAALGLAFLLGLIGYLVYKQQRLKNTQIRKESELKQALAEIENQNNLQEQRLAISKDLHDNIGSQLTFIISSLDNLKYFEFTKDKLYAKFDSIGGFTRSTITDLRDTIWAMNKEDVTFEDLKARTTNFIETAKTSLLGIQFEFNYPENSEAIKLNSLQGIDVYRIVQEAINNAVKHAKATKITVNFEIIENQVAVSIIDNGIGFDPKTIEAGNGFSSMRKRAKEIGGVLAIESLENNGTKVSLSFGMN